MTFDSVVVGAGVSGLASALILAKEGRRVAVVEKAPRLAPLIRGFSRQGVYFDSAFHYTGGLGDGEVLDLFFRYLGLSSRLIKYPFRRDGFDLFRDVDRGREFRFPTGFMALQEALGAAFPGEGAAIDGYFAALTETCRFLPYLDPETPAENWGNGLTQGRSLADVLDKLTSNRELKSLLSMHTLLHGVPPHEVSFAIHASVAGLYYRSAFGISGGGLSIADAFEAQLSEAGVTTFLGRPAKALKLTTGNHLQGVELEGGEILECGECIVSTHPSRFLDIVPEGAVKPAFRKRLANLEETASAFILYAKLDHSFSPLKGMNLILGRQDSLESSWSGELDKRPLFVAANCVDENSDSGSGWVAICPAQWQETQEWSTARYRGHEPGYVRFKEEIAETLLERIYRQAPEVAGQASIVETATPLTLRDYAGSPTGGLYGVKHKVGQYNPQAATRIPGVYLTGQAAAAPGLLGAMVSAFLTCGHLFGHDHLRKGVLACR